MKSLYAIAALTFLGACGAPVSTASTQIIPGDRSHDVQVRAAGAASCGALSSAQMSTALATTNAYRAQGGLGALRVNAQLTQAAQQQACFMARSGRMTHAGPDGEGSMTRAARTGYNPRIIAENIGYGKYGVPGIITAWNNSPGHRSNAMHPRINEFGIGVATDAAGTEYWAAVYGGQQ